MKGWRAWMTKKTYSHIKWHKVDAGHKVRKPSGFPTKGAGADDPLSHSASAKARAARDFGTLFMWECQAMFAVTYIPDWCFLPWTWITRLLMPSLMSRYVIPPWYQLFWPKRHWADCLCHQQSWWNEGWNPQSRHKFSPSTPRDHHGCMLCSQVPEALQGKLLPQPNQSWDPWRVSAPTWDQRSPWHQGSLQYLALLGPQELCCKQ